MDQQDIQHVPPDVRIFTSNIVIFFCKNQLDTTFDMRFTSDLMFRLINWMTLTDKNLNIKIYNDQRAPKLRVLTTGATATKFQPASSLAVFTLHDCMALFLSTAVNKNLFCHDGNIGQCHDGNIGQKTIDNGH